MNRMNRCPSAFFSGSAEFIRVLSFSSQALSFLSETHNRLEIEFGIEASSYLYHHFPPAVNWLTASG
jgi:hypothetical protein